MVAYWAGVSTGLIGVASALAVATGNPFAATPAFLVLLVAFVGLDVPLSVAGGLETWRDAISRSTPALPLLFVAGLCVFAIPSLVAYLIIVLASGFSRILVAWFVLVLGATVCSWSMLYLLARASTHRLQLSGDARG